GIDPTDWRISPVYGDLSVLPKTLLLTGSRDLLTPDNLIFAEKARAAGVEIEVVHEQGMFHVWPLIDMPEARRARDSIVAFLTNETDSYHATAGELSLQRTDRDGTPRDLVAPLRS
ncbi:MAG: alpha/beta hydrolase, partial [Mesorhizobium sp.]